MVIFKTIRFNYNMWIEKYKPDNFKNFIDNKKSIRLLKEWYENYLNGIDKRNVIIIGGPIGCGKTLLFELFSKINNLKVININTNNKHSNVKNILIKNLKFKNILSFMNDRKICILLDNINLMKDKKQINELIKISIKNNKIVFFITDKINNLSNKNTFSIELLKPKYDEVVYYIKNILKKENKNLDYKIIKEIYNNGNGDIRYILNNLYEITFINPKKTIDISYNIKDISLTYDELLNLFIKKKLSLNEICNNLYNSSFIPFTLYDNFHTINDFNKYTICMKSFNDANIINNGLFLNSNHNNDYFNILSTGYYNLFASQKKNFNPYINAPIVLNKLKIFKSISTPYEYPLILLIILYKFFLRIDKKNKNINKVDTLKVYMIKYKINYNKFLKLI